MLISDYIAKKNTTQRKFAEEIGCTTAFINSLINGKNTDIKISLLRKIAHKIRQPEAKLISELLAFKGQEGAHAGTKPKR